MRDSLTVTRREDNAPPLRQMFNTQRFETEQHEVHLSATNSCTSLLRIFRREGDDDFLEARSRQSWSTFLSYQFRGIKPMRRAKSLKRGSERRLSNLCSALRFTSPSERSS
jgi:hypothetical protein